MKTWLKILSITLFFFTTQIALAAQTVWVDRHVQAFLDKLNASGGKPMEQMTPQDARQVLVNLQAKTPVDLSGIEVSEKTIKENGKTIKLNIVRPAGVTGTLPVFMFFHGGGWGC